MKQFIVLTAITGELIAIRPSSIIHIEECNSEHPKIVIKAESTSWNISSKKHSVESILKDIENIEK